MNYRLLFVTAFISLILLGICLVYAEQILQPEGIYVEQSRNIDGSLSFTVRTVTYNGPYGPRNAGAIWITNGSNQFVKTIKVWANQYRYTLVRWLASSGNNTTGAITGASLNSHQLHSITWNARNASGTLVDDGVYNINVEFTEHNASSSNMGKYKTVSFTKGIEPVSETIPNATYFRDMQLTWTPVIVNGTISGMVSTVGGTPLQGATILVSTHSATSGVDGRYSLSLPPGSYTVTCVKQGYQDQVINDVQVISAQITELNFPLQTEISIQDPQLPSPELRIVSVSPNPFMESTQLRYKLSSSEQAMIYLFNSRGQLVQRSNITADASGWGEYQLSRRTASGSRLSSGIYYCVIESSGKRAGQQVVIR